MAIKMAKHTLAKAKELMNIAIEQAWEDKDAKLYEDFLKYIRQAPRTYLWLLLMDAVREARAKQRSLVMKGGK